MREASRMHRRVWVWRRADRSDFRLIISGCKSEANNPRSRFRARRLRPSARGRRRRSRSAFWASTAAACERATLFRAEVSRGGEEAGPSGASESSSPRTCDRLGAPNPRVGAAPATPTSAVARGGTAWALTSRIRRRLGWLALARRRARGPSGGRRSFSGNTRGGGPDPVARVRQTTFNLHYISMRLEVQSVTAQWATRTYGKARVPQEQARETCDKRVRRTRADTCYCLERGGRGRSER